MKKRLFLGVLISLVAVAAGAQVQYGYVKTKGTLGKHGGQKRGERLNGVTVSVRGGSSVVSAGKGEFSFNPPGKSFSFSSVSKSGYVLTDKDFLGRNFVASSEWKVIVMEKPEQRAKEKEVIVYKIDKTLEAQLKKQKKEIERLEKEGKKSKSEIYKLQAQLYESQEKKAKLVEEMAEKLVSIDYDQMDDVNRQAAELILNGELEKAKRLLDNQGNPEDSFNDIVNRRKQLEKELTQLGEETNILAERFLNYHNIFLMEYNNDSAAYYLEKRVELDPTNVQWQLEAGDFIREYLAQYDKAKSYYEAALQLALKNSERHPAVATCYNNIGIVLYNQGNYSEAMEYYKKSLEIRKEVYGERHPDVATSYNNIGIVLCAQGNYSEALEYHKKSLEIRKEVYGECHPDVAASYNNIGNVLDDQGNYSEAMEYYKKSLDIEKEIHGERHLSVSTSYNNIGLVLFDQGNYSEAMEYHKKSLEIRKEIYGEGHPDVAVSYNNIGNVFSEQGNYSEAMEYYKRSLEVKKEIYGELHSSVATSYNNIGIVLYNQGNYSEAMEYYKKSLEIRKEIYGELHSSVATSYNNIGNVLFNQGNYSEALEYYNKSLEISKEIYGERHLDVAVSYKNIGNVLFNQGNYSEALEYLKKAYNIFVETLGTEHSYTKNVELCIKYVIEKLEE